MIKTDCKCDPGCSAWKLGTSSSFLTADHEALDEPGRAVEAGQDLCKLVEAGEEFASLTKGGELAT